jgi:predicted Zn-ribbon and HTH transcriptional regulator
MTLSKQATGSKRGTPRKRVKIVQITVDGVEADAKECTKCGEVKDLMGYHKSKNGLGGRRNVCRVCINVLGECKRPLLRTTESYSQEVWELVGEEYEVLGEFAGVLTPTTHLHNNCGYKWEIRPNNFINGSRCPKCAGNINKTHEEYVEEVSAIFGDEYEVLSEYISARKTVIHRHNVCGYEWKTLPSAIITKGSRCPKCALTIIAEANRKSHTEYVAEVNLLTGEEYSVIGDYEGSVKPLLHRHNSCGYEWSATPSNFKQGSRCPICAVTNRAYKLRKKPDDYIAEVKSLVGDGYTVIGEYTTAVTHTLHRHNVCGHEWLAQPYSFLRGHLCPRCSESKGERRVRDYIRFLGYEFLMEEKVPEVRGVGGGFLRFDCVITDISGWALVVEFDGIQHFEPRDMDGKGLGYAIRQFNRQQEHDRRKDAWAAAQGIPLLRIRYDEFDEIETKINEALAHVIRGEYFTNTQRKSNAS